MFFGRNVMAYCHPVFGFDIISFDQLMKDDHGYVEDGETSCLDFVESRWGEEGVNLILKLIKM
jgi:hypothetical protein